MIDEGKNMKREYTLLQRLSVSIFKKNIDNNLAIFKMSKLYNKTGRYCFYWFLLLTVSVSFYLSSYLFDFILNSYEIKINEDANVFFDSIGFAMLTLEILLVSLIFVYESLTLEKIEEIEKNAEKKKKNKMQWWRLRNMNLFFRIISYFTLWFIPLQIYYYFMISFIIQYIKQFQNESESVVFLDENMKIFLIGISMIITILIISTEIKIKKEK